MRALISEHPTIATFAMAGLFWLVGLMEQRALQRSDITCVTWLWGLLIATAGVVGMDEIGVARWAFALLLLIGGIALIFSYYRQTR